MTYRQARKLKIKDEVYTIYDKELYTIFDKELYTIFDKKIGVYMGSVCMNLMLRRKYDGKIFEQYHHHSVVKLCEKK